MKNDVRTLKWIFNKAKRIFGYLILLTVLGLLVSLVGVSFSMASKKVFDVVTGDANGTFSAEIVKLTLLVAFQLVLQISFSMASARASGKLGIHIKKILFGKLLIKDFSSVSAYHSGELVNRLNSDVSVVTSAITEILPNGISYASKIILSFTVLYMLDSSFALICLIFGPVVLLVSQIYRKKIKTLYKNCQESDGKTRSFMQECLQNLLMIKSFGSEDIITRHSTELQNENFSYSIKRSNVSIIANVLFYIAVTAGYFFALAWGAYKLSRGLITFGTVTAMLQLVGQIQTPFRSISSIFPQYFVMLGAAERIMELDDLPEEQEPENPDSDSNTLYRDMKEIVLNNVTFAYDSQTVLLETDFAIEKGEIIAIAGDSGIGKSTLLKLLLGIISPKNGDAYIKLNDGKHIKLGKGTRGIFAYVPQGNMIISGTIRENISFSKEDVNDCEIEKSAKTAEIWDFISELPEGLETVIGEKGLGLSEGQIQRIAIARAIYRNAPIILLDEATAALDEKTEVKLLGNIKQLDNKTCIIVSHRKEAFKICHKAYRIENGRFELFTYK